MKVVMIGTGNTAFVLGKKIAQGGHQIVQVIGRDMAEAHELGSYLNAAVVYNTRYVNLSADVYIIAVADSAIAAVAAQLKLKDKLLVHTAAAVSKDVLSIATTNYGVLYPLQTLKKHSGPLPIIPVIIDGNTKENIKMLVQFAARWTETVEVAGDEERLKLHVAAVFVNNFTNHLLTVAEQYCIEEKLNFNVLYPLVEETILRIKTNSPAIVQTGPAVRNDYFTIAKHSSLLTNYPQAAEIYKVMTESIKTFYKSADAEE